MHKRLQNHHCMRFLMVSDDSKPSYNRFLPGSTPEQATDTSTNTLLREPVKPFSALPIPLFFYCSNLWFIKSFYFLLFITLWPFNQISDFWCVCASLSASLIYPLSWISSSRLYFQILLASPGWNLKCWYLNIFVSHAFKWVNAVQICNRTVLYFMFTL